MQTKRSFDWRYSSTSVLALILLVGFAALPVFGDSLTVSGGPPGTSCGQTVASGATMTSCSAPAYGDTAMASGNLAAGTFGASASVSPPNPLLGSTTFASVSITYDFTVTGTQSGTADFNLVINGTQSGSSTGCTQPGGCVVLVAYLDYPGLEGILIGGVPGPQGSLQLSSGVTDLIVGTNIANGIAQLNLQITETVGCSANFSTCSASADYLDPATITGASVYDSNGNLVPGATLVSDSGFNPNAGSPVPTPEPAGLLLLGVGLMALFAISARRAVA